MRSRRRAVAVMAAVVAALVATTATTVLGVSGAAALSGRPGETPSGSGGPAVAVPAAGTFYPLAPVRLLGTETGYALGSGTSVPLSPLGRSGLPSSGVSALVVNVTATASGADAGVSLTPSGTPPSSALVTAPAGGSRSVLLTVPLGPDGGLVVGAGTAPVSVTVDAVGFYAADDTVIASQGQSGGYQPVDVTRVFDTGGRAPLAAGARQVVSIDLGAGVTPHTTAVVLRATATTPAGAGSLLISGAAAAPAGTVAFAAGTAASNLAVVPTGSASPDRIDVTVTNGSAGATGVTLDLVGFYDDGRLGPNLRYRPLPQTVLVDTRAGQGTDTLQPGRPVTVGATDAVASDSTFGLVGVLTSTATAAARVALDDGDDTQGAGADVAPGVSTTAVQPEVGAARTVRLSAQGASAVDVRLDVTGSFEAYPPVSNPSARGWVPAVPGWQISATTP